ncbi:hypothetical protein [Nocardioides humi]|uniref:Uncharacterized protein n=1 Tax=Nocardioides humi TaxID=449461 RepID=A0ABN2AM84_9ACTN|nr:hypothetical protein [Nocardioides humi]
MRTGLRTGLRSTVGIAALLGATLLTGCSEDLGERLAERAVEEQFGEGAQVDIDADGVRIEDGEGNSYVSGTGLPVDFPDDIPLVDGRVLSGVAVDDREARGWSVNVEVDDDAQAAFDAAVLLLVEAGFKEQAGLPAGVLSAQLVNRTWSVVLAVYADPSAQTATVGYTVGDSAR